MDLSAHFTSPKQVLYLNLDVSDATQMAQFLTSHSSSTGYLIYVDCLQLRNFKRQGFCHVISQLLQLRQTGATVCLHNVNRLFYRVLRLLQLVSLFEVSRYSSLSSLPRLALN